MAIYDNGEERFGVNGAWLTADEVESLAIMRPINRTRAQHAQDTEWALAFATGKINAIDPRIRASHESDEFKLRSAL